MAATLQTVPAPVAYGLGDIAALVGYTIYRRGRRVARANMRGVLGAGASRQRVERAALGAFHTAAYHYVDTARTPHMNPHELRRHNIRVVGVEHLLAASRTGRGGIGVSLHYGSPEYVSQALTAWGFHFLALVEPLADPDLQQLSAYYRHNHGHTFIPADFSGIKRAIRFIKKGGVVALMIDRDIQHNGIEVPLFGRTARVPTGAIDLAMHTGADIIPYITHRDGRDRFTAIIRSPFTLIRTGNADEDRRVNTARLIQLFEPPLRRDPSQWAVLHEPVWVCDRERVR